MTCPHEIDLIGAPPGAELNPHVAACDDCRKRLEWERRLVAEAKSLGARQEHEAYITRRAVPSRVLGAVACLMIIGLCIWALHRTHDPVARIESQYSDVERMERLLKNDRWSPEVRRTFRDAMSQVNQAIELSKQALRTSPADPDCAELVHVAYRAKRRLIETVERSHP